MAGNESPKAKKSSSLVLKIIIGVLLVSIAGISVCGAVYYNDYKQMKESLDINTIYNNIYINNVDVGGLTKEEAISKLNSELENTFNSKKVTLTNNEDSFDFTYSQFGAKYDLNSAVEQAYNYGRTDGTIKERYTIVKNLETEGKYLTADYSYDKELTKNAIALLEDKVYTEPKNAYAKREDGKFIITPGTNGYKLNLDSTSEEVYKVLDKNEEGNISIIREEVEPKYTEKDFEKMNSLIGTSSTSYSGSGGRITNMKVAASRINGTTLYPGEVFSTNECFGPSTEANGYKPAPSIINGKLVDDYGGGVCQVSSTLYNALLKAELSIVERQNHSLKVGYLDYGYDATLAGDYIDLKFKNSTPYPIYLESYLTGNKVIANIYGYEEHSPNRKVTFQNALIETIAPPAEHITYDKNLQKGTRKVTTTALNGYRYKLYKLVYEGDKLIEKVEVNTSYYKPRRAEVTVGTKEDSVSVNAAIDKNITSKPNEANETENTVGQNQESPEPQQTETSAPPITEPVIDSPE